MIADAFNAVDISRVSSMATFGPVHAGQLAFFSTSSISRCFANCYPDHLRLKYFASPVELLTPRRL